MHNSCAANIQSTVCMYLFIYSCLCACRLTKAQRASLSSWWHCPGPFSKGSQSWSILRGKTETWRRFYCRLLRTQTVELSYNKVRIKKRVKGCRIEGEAGREKGTDGLGKSHQILWVWYSTSEILCMLVVQIKSDIVCVWWILNKVGWCSKWILLRIHYTNILTKLI